MLIFFIEVNERNKNLDKLIEKLIDPPRIFLDKLNEKVEAKKLYLVNDLFDQSLVQYILNGFDKDSLVKDEYLRRVSHRAYSIFYRLGIKVNALQGLPVHYHDILGWKVRQKDERIFGEYMPSNWY